MNLKHTFYAVAVIVTAGIVSACLHESDAQTTSSGGITRAEFDAYKAEIAARFAALEASQPGDKVVAGGTAGLAKAARAGSREIGTAVGFLPVTKAAHQSTHFIIKSALGFIYFVPNDNRNSNGRVGIGTYAGDSATGSRPVYFTTDDCSSLPFVPGTDVSDYGAYQGLVFMIGDGTFNEVIDNPAQYLYVAQGSERFSDLAYASKTTNASTCTQENGVLPVAYLAAPNDPGVTGVASAPVEIPITLN